MQGPGRRVPTKEAMIVLFVITLITVVCVFFTIILLKFFDLNTVQTLYVIFTSILTLAFTIAGFTLLYYEWRVADRWHQPPLPPIESPFQHSRSLVGLIPYTESKAIQKCESVVKDVYDMLIQINAPAVVLTGIVGVGKSTIAALTCQYAEEQRKGKKGPFTEKPLWIEIDPNVSINDLGTTFFMEFGMNVPNFESMSPQNQAAVLFNLLDEVNETRLIVLDQMDRLLNIQTGQVFENRQGIGEWLNTILTRTCKSRVLLTSRSLPGGLHGYNLAVENEYCIKRLDDTESKQLLRIQGGILVEQAEPDELDKAIFYCDNHPLALTLLAHRLRTHNLGLTAFFNDWAHVKLWKEEIASYGPDGGLDFIFTLQLTPLQQKILLAVSIFRIPVPRIAVQTLLKFIKPTNLSLSIAETFIKLQILDDKLLHNCEILLHQHLIQSPRDQQDYYQLHPLIAAYARDRFARNDAEANKKLLNKMHKEAAEYYLRQVQNLKEPQIGNLRQLYIVEAIWHLCQSGNCNRAYQVMKKYQIASHLQNQNENRILFDLFQQILPSDEWHPKPLEKLDIYNNLGDVCVRMSKKEDALKFYRAALDVARNLGDTNQEQNITAIIRSIDEI